MNPTELQMEQMLNQGILIYKKLNLFTAYQNGTMRILVKPVAPF
jgi:hypothetical protein